MDKFFVSSTGSGISLTAKGLSVGGFMPVILAAAVIARSLGYDISDSAAVQVAELGVFAVSLFLTTLGLLRKLYFRFAS